MSERRGVEFYPEIGHKGGQISRFCDPKPGEIWQGELTISGKPLRVTRVESRLCGSTWVSFDWLAWRAQNGSRGHCTTIEEFRIWMRQYGYRRVDAVLDPPPYPRLVDHPSSWLSHGRIAK